MGSQRDSLREFTNEIHRVVMRAAERGLDWRSNLATRRAYSAAITRAIRKCFARVKLPCGCGMPWCPDRGD